MDEEVFLKVEGFTFLEYDPKTGTSTYFRTNEDGSTTVYSRSDNDLLIQANKDTFFDKANHKLGDWVPLARMDDLTMNNLEMSKRIEQKDRKSIAKVLNDGDFAAFRTSNLKV